MHARYRTNLHYYDNSMRTAWGLVRRLSAKRQVFEAVLGPRDLAAQLPAYNE